MNESADVLWSHVVRRESSADGMFVYAVHTTGVFCVPSCSSRRPLRRNVAYYPTAAMAMAAGYRPCKRCRPDAPIRANDATEAVQVACAAIARSPHVSWPAQRIARVAGLPVAALRRRFRRALGISPGEFVAACRRGYFLAQLKKGIKVTEAIYRAGYGSTSRAYDAPHGGVPPASYRRGGAGSRIEWTIVASPIGKILVAATDRGACFVAVGGDVDELATAVRAEFPKADLVRGASANTRRLATAARAVACAEPVSLGMPADIVGTAFQWRVWRALTRIPLGKTLTYSELARAIGHPTAVRAVARACATNPLALVVPCHRVVGTDGTLRGYRWGTERKAQLIRVERQAHPKHP